MSFRLALAAMALGLALAGCVSRSGAVMGPVSRNSAQAASADANPRQTLGIVNAFRAQHGLPPVRLDPAVMAAARTQSLAMAQQGVMSHYAGGDFRGRLQASGVGRAPAVENIAWGQRTLAEAMATWRASPKHAENMLSPDMTRLGVAAAHGAGGTYWTLVLAGNSR